MALDRAEVLRIARLARIRIPDEEVDVLAGELSAILGWIEKLDEVDVAGVEPMAGVGVGVGGASAPARADAAAEGAGADRILANAPEAAEGHFVVPKAVE